MNRYLLLFTLQFFALYGLRGQCDIVAKREVCIDDLVNFNLTVSSGTAASYAWDFGSYGTSTNSSPLMKFTASGKLVVACTATLVGGQTCADTHQLEILVSPASKFGVASESKFCLHENNVCLNDSSSKGSKGIAKINIVWGDGKLSQFIPPLAKKWCHVYSDTGWHSVNMEVQDSGGCRAKFTVDVHLHPSIIHSLPYSKMELCDSVFLCLNNGVSGGDSIVNNWYSWPDGKSITLKTPWCKMLQPDEFLQLKLVSYNEFGCRDSTIFEHKVPPTTFYLKRFIDSICSKKLEDMLVLFKSGEEVEWSLNGMVEGRDTVYKGNPSSRLGKNYIEILRLGSCTGKLLDSIIVLGVPAKAAFYNDNRRKVEDTVFFLDITGKNTRSGFSRLWDFGDKDAENCITDTRLGLNVGKNCNFSRDSIARHFYPDTLCYLAKLTMYDSFTRCYDDTAFNIFRNDMCPPFFIPPNVCTNEFANFTMPVSMERKVGDSNFLIMDINGPLPWDTLKMVHGFAAYLYQTAGWKSPVIWRYYGPDTVWTERNGKIVVNFVRNGEGWVADTFTNQVEVYPKAVADFDLVTLSPCSPFKVQLNFHEKKWMYPDTIFISWGDTQEIIGNFKDTFFNMVPLEHTYKNGGLFKIILRLKPYKGCDGSHTAEVQFSHSTVFRSLVTCLNEPVFFKDSVSQLGIKYPKNLWTAAQIYGQLYWDFGDGTKDTGYNMSHVYNSIGDFVVTLAARNHAGCDIIAKDTIRLTGPKAGIATPPAIYCNEARQYFDSSFMILPNNGQSITRWSWNFGDGSALAPAKNPVHIFPAGGTYYVKLKVTTNRGCIDTATRAFQVVGPEVFADIVSDSMGCAPLTVHFANKSKQTGNFIWQFGDPNNTNYSTNKDTNTWFTYKNAGEYFVHLIGGDSFFNPVTGNKYYCSVKYPGPGQKPMRIKVYEATNTSFNAPIVICIGDTLTLENTSSNSNLLYRWVFGSGDSALRNKDTFFYRYSDTGTYKIKLYAEIKGAEKLSCFDTTEKQIHVVTVHPDFNQDCNSANGSELFLKNLSGSNIQGYRWTLLDPTDSSEQLLSDQFDLHYAFGNQTGLKWICLSLGNGKACGGKICKQIFIQGDIFIANVFTPGKDGFNDTYKIPLQEYNEFHLLVFNRWGEKVFESKDPKTEWNGKVFNTGAELPDGSYFYRLTYSTNCDKAAKNVSGSITLIR